jgi:hypothetical protein
LRVMIGQMRHRLVVWHHGNAYDRPTFAFGIRQG